MDKIKKPIRNNNSTQILAHHVAPWTFLIIMETAESKVPTGVYAQITLGNRTFMLMK
jgi:hypothetical protein